MDERLKATIDKIRLLAKQNPEFANEMQKLFGKSGDFFDKSILASVSDDVTIIRSTLEIRANASITYDFVKEQRLRDQLLVDNLRMENAALNLQESEADRFYAFCVNAFYQIENIVNYYYHITYRDINSLLDEIESYTLQEPEKYRYKRTGKERNVSSIPIAHKINAFCNAFAPDDKYIKWTIGSLRQVRNEGEHRCAIIREERNDSNNLYKFFKVNTFNSVRADLIKIVTIIKQHLNSPLEKATERVVKITNKLPSACFVSVGNNRVRLPENLFSKVKNFKENDSIKVILKGNAIVDVII